jgi:hypothetical protein
MRGRYRAGVIGRTHHGDYGHGLDIAFADAPEIDCVAVADDDEDGLKTA